MLPLFPAHRFVTLASLCLIFIFCAPSLAKEFQQAERAEIPMVLHANVKIPSRDGVVLRADIYLPNKEGAFPAILLRTPYSASLRELSEDKTINQRCREFAAEFVASGFAFVIQDCRGTGRSDGVWQPYVHERDDGIDLQRWVLQQSWCNGRLGLFGGSYCGYTQWAVASSAESGLKAMCNDVPLFNWYDVYFTNGAFRLETNTVWNALMARPGAHQNPLVRLDAAGWKEGIPLQNGKSWDEVLKHLPLRTTGEQTGEQVPWLCSALNHPQFDEYWHPTSTTLDLNNVSVPNLTFSGWYDLFVMHALRYLPEVREQAKDEIVRRHQHLIIGPWGHQMGVSVGELSFGDEANLELARLRAQWYGHWLAGQKSGVDSWPFLKIFVMGENRWRSENEWPLARTRYTKFYFRSDGSANTRSGDGYLTTTAPGDEAADHYTYDPRNPVPTYGGYWSFLTPSGPREQEVIENRTDVLVYTSEELQAPLEVTGPVKVVLYAASDAPDTDWTAKLIDVHPDGRAFNLCDGIIRARFRNPTAPPTLIEPGKVYRYEIDLWATSNQFLKGHRIRVQISSSNFPCFDRNLNTGHPIGIDSGLRPANQTIYHGRKHPSHILLPVIPR